MVNYSNLLRTMLESSCVLYEFMQLMVHSNLLSIISDSDRVILQRAMGCGVYEFKQ